MCYYIVKFFSNNEKLQEENTIYRQVFESGELTVKAAYLSSTPSLVWHTRKIDTGYRHFYLLYLPISIFIFYILLYR